MFYEIPAYVTFYQSFFGSMVLCTLVYISTKNIFPRIENSTASLACSTVHAILSSYWSINSWIYHWDKVLEGSASLMTGTPRHHDYMLCSFTAGYMIFDTVLSGYVDYQAKLLWYQFSDTVAAVTVVGSNGNETMEQQYQRTLKALRAKRLLTPEMMLHHVIGLFTTLTSVISQMVVPYVAMFILCELSTPFVNFHHILPSNSPWKIPNGICMFLSFGIVRIGFVTLTIRSSLYSYNGTDDNGRRGSDEYPGVFLSMFIIIIPLYCLNLFWFYRIASGLVHKLREGKNGHGTTHNGSTTVSSSSSTISSSTLGASITSTSVSTEMEEGPIVDIPSSPSNSRHHIHPNSLLIHHTSSPELKKTNSLSNDSSSSSSGSRDKNKVK